MYKISLVHYSLNLVANALITVHNKGVVSQRFLQVIQDYAETGITTLTADTSVRVNIASVVSYSIYSVDFRQCMMRPGQ